MINHTSVVSVDIDEIAIVARELRKAEPWRSLTTCISEARRRVTTTRAAYGSTITTPELIEAVRAEAEQRDQDENPHANYDDGPQDTRDL